MKLRQGLIYRPAGVSKLLSILIFFAHCLSGCKDNLSNPDPSGEIAGIIIQSEKTELWLEDTIQLTAHLISAGGDTLPARNIQWATIDSDKLSISENGRIEALKTGTAEITARYESFSDTLSFNIYTYALIFDSQISSSSRSLFLLNLNDESATPVRFEGTEAYSFEPAVSHDGRLIAYSAFDAASYNTDLYLYHIEDKTSTRITYSTDIDDMPNWSPDDRKIVFRREITRGGDIMIYDFSDQSIVNLTDVPDVYIEDRQPAFSPDGSEIVFSSTESGRMNIYFMKADGSNKRQLRFTEHYDTETAWSPDGKKIIYRTNFPDGIDFTIYEFETNTYLRLEIPGYEFTPAWSPDGKWIAFAWRENLQERPEIYMMRPDGSEMKRITEDEWNGGQNPAFLRIQ